MSQKSETYRGFNKIVGIFIVTYHVLLLLSLIWYFSYNTPSFALVMTSIALFFITGISITAGYHRYYSHSTYKAHPIVEFVMLFFASMAVQGSALRWSFDHRLHHAYVDTEEDPYSVNKGFWYAHIMWMFEKPKTIEKKVVSDLYRNKMVMFQHEHYLFCLIASNAIAFLFVGYLLNDFVGAFIISWWTRLFVLHHCTWFINSLAHYWGSQNFSQEHTAVDNYIISLLTFGEGYHNYHHTFANDYRNGICWYHFDPTKWVIWTLSKLGLAHSLKKVSALHIKEKLVLARKKELIETIQKSFVSGKDELVAKASDLSSGIIVKLNQVKELMDQYTSCKNSGVSTNELREQIQMLKQKIREDWKNYRRFSKDLRHSM